MGNNERLSSIQLPSLAAATSDVWIRSGDVGAASLAVNLPSFASSANPDTDLCIQANGGEVGPCFEPAKGVAAKGRAKPREAAAVAASHL